MELWQKITAGALAGGVIIGGVYYLPKLFQLGHAAPQLDVIPTAQIHKIDLTGLTVRIDVQLKNPTPVAFKMNYPYVRVTTNGSLLGTSQSVDRDIEMSPFGEANITGIMVHFPMLSLVSLGFGFLKAVQANKEVKIDIATITHIDPYWTYDRDKKTWTEMKSIFKKVLIPVNESKPVTLRKKA